jgi:hypothetical protein
MIDSNAVLKHTVESAVLELKLVGDIAGRFFVPRYQRGFRWGAHEVTYLLDDIWKSGGAPYSLQPIVVKRCIEPDVRSDRSLSDSEFELVDGQQRLTTLYLILHYMQREHLQNAAPPWSITYETRPESAVYLENLGANVDSDEEASRSNIDYYHIYDAYRCVQAWFDNRANRRQHVANKFYGFLYDSVRVIWYEAPPALDSTTLFTRLNVGRIPLTDAELFKALLLSRSDSRAHERAAQWDSIERDLRNPDLWAFATADHPDDRPTRITLLLDALADRVAGGGRGVRRQPFQTFDALRAEVERTTPEEVWNRVVDLHALVVGWFEDRDLYHKIGFLVAAGVPFGELVEVAENKTRSCFQTLLDKRIRRVLRLTQRDVSELSYITETGREKCRLLLLLMNVETVRSIRDSTERFSFRSFREKRWSLEHIHAQNPEVLKTVDQWSEWLRLHREALAALPTDDVRCSELVAGIDDALTRPLDRLMFESLAARVNDVFTSVDDSATDPHTIANLALLTRGDNSALGNSVFEVKRRRILEMDRAGAFIPNCTRNVFLKYYTDAGAEQIHMWSPQDRERYLAAIVEKARPYLTAEESTS